MLYSVLVCQGKYCTSNLFFIFRELWHGQSTPLNHECIGIMDPFLSRAPIFLVTREKTRDI